jgi:NADH dehydrogenase
MSTRVLIVGGGFGGVETAKSLGKDPRFAVTLISERSWLEYYGSLYRILRRNEFSRVCIELAEMLPQSVALVVDRIEGVDPSAKKVVGTHGTYEYDVLVLAPGAEPAYFGIPGMKEQSMTLRNVADAIKLRKHLDDLLAKPTLTEAEKNFVVVGSGPTGVETAAELLVHEGDRHSSAVRVTLLEAADRILPSMPEVVSVQARKRLESLGVTVLTQKKVTGCEPGKLLLADGQIEASTVVWTAGVKAHSLLEKIPGLQLDKRGRAAVDGELRAAGVQDIFVTGDAAVTQFSGMAQTAVYDGAFVASVLKGQKPTYAAGKPKFAIPIGKWWAAVVFGPLNIFGLLGYFLREAADMKVFLMLTSPPRALQHFLGWKMDSLEKAVAKELKL